MKLKESLTEEEKSFIDVKVKEIAVLGVELTTLQKVLDKLEYDTEEYEIWHNEYSEYYDELRKCIEDITTPQYKRENPCYQCEGEFMIAACESCSHYGMFEFL